MVRKRSGHGKDFGHLTPVGCAPSTPHYRYFHQRIPLPAVNTYAILRRNAWTDATELEKAAGLSSRVGLVDLASRVRWIRSYVIREIGGRLGLICIFQSTDAETLRDHAKRAGLPADEIIPVAETIVLHDDPLPAA